MNNTVMKPISTKSHKSHTNDAQILAQVIPLYRIKPAICRLLALFYHTFQH